jgi:medium-chain acyl-[acyl-carrier-protein] hydrolase
MRLFCLPYAGGGSSVYRFWSKGLPSFVDVCPIQLPGRETRLEEPAAIRIGPLAEAIAQAILPYLDKPFAFFGHSMGALVAYEVARRLRDDNGLEPVHLFASAHGSPHIPGNDRDVYKLSDSEFLKHLQTLNGTPHEVLDCPELMQILLPTLKADFELLGTYEYKPEAPFSCPITVFGGTQDHSVTPEEIAGWQIHTTGNVSVKFLPGDHFYLSSHKSLLLRMLTEEVHRIAHQL